MTDLGPGPFTTVRRLPEKARYDEATIFAVLDAAPFCYLAGVHESRAVILPTLHVRDGRRLYFHGSRSNAMFASLLASGRACISAAVYDGLRLARSGFESSIAYRSVVAYGTLAVVAAADAPPILDAFVESRLPGRAHEIRRVTDRESRQTSLVVFEIEEASAKISAGPTDDDAVDQGRPIWSGVLPAHVSWGAPIPSFDGAMGAGTVPVSPSVVDFYSVDRAEVAARVRTQVEHIDPVDVRERESIAALLDRLSWRDDPFSEGADPRHITASALLVSDRGIILHRHRHLGIWVQPGGHVDEGETPEIAVLREVLEETGLVGHLLNDEGIFHVDVHQGPRGHTHYDLRYLVQSDGADPHPRAGESPDVEWLGFPDARTRAEPALRAVLTKVESWVREQT